MKIAIISTILVFVPPTLAASKVSNNKYNVRVSCSGIDNDALSLKALSFSAKALESSYDAVYKNARKSLKTVSSTGLGVEQCNKCDDEFASVLTFSVSATTGASGLEQCNKCDDELSENMGMRAAWETEFASAVANGPYVAFHNANECTIKSIQEDVGVPVATHKEFPVGLDVECDGLDLGELSVDALVFTAKALQDTYNSLHEAIDGSIMDDNMVLSGLNVEQCNKCDDALAENKNSISFTAQIGMTGKGLPATDLDDARKLRGSTIPVMSDSSNNNVDQCNKCDDELLDAHMDSRIAKLAMSGLGVEHSKTIKQCNKCDDSMFDVTQCNKCDDEIFDRSISAANSAWERLFLSRLLLHSKSEFGSAKHCYITMKHA